MLLHSRGFCHLHAAGLEKDNYGYILVGKSGSGKTSNAIHLVEYGWNYLSDDMVLIRYNDNGEVEMLAIPNEFKLNRKALDRNSMTRLFKHSYSIRNNDKRFIRIQKAYPDRFIGHCVPKVIIFPKIIPEPVSRLSSLSQSEALKELIHESPVIFLRHSFKNQHLDILKNLVLQCVSYQLLAGRDIYHSPEYLPTLLLGENLKGEM